MSNIREIPILSTVRGDLQEDGAVEELAQDLINDLNTVATQWNDNVYPLVATLPNGPVRKIRADRTDTIDPVANGLDGSQVFLDQTSRPEEFNGLLHNGSRPKTIKEVLLEVYQGILARQNSIEGLLENVSSAAESYDDAQLRSWILKLAAETWDPSEIALGATINTGNFAGAPVKGSTYSLNTRDKNLRNILGVEGESLGLTAIDTLLAGANYISGDTDVIAALLTLDDTISGMGGAVTLQDVYDSSGAGSRRIEELSADPIEIIAATGNDNALVLRGGIQLLDTIDADTEENVFWIGPEHSGDADTGQFDLKLFTPDNALVSNEIVRFSVNKGATVDPEDEVVELFLGKITANGDLQRGALHLGRERVAQGGEPHLTIDSYKNGVVETARLSTPLSMFEISAVGGDFNFEFDVDFSVEGNYLIEADEITIQGNVQDVNLASAGDINLQSATAISIDTVTFEGTDINIQSHQLIDVDATTGITIDTATNAVEIMAVDTDENSFVHITSNGIGTGDIAEDRIASYLKTTGSNHDVEIRSDNATAVVAGEDVLLTSNGTVQIGGDSFQFIATDWTTGLSFEDDNSIPTEGSLLRVLGSTRGKIYTKENAFSNTSYQSVASEATRLILETGVVRIMANAPTIKGTSPGASSYGESISTSEAGRPDNHVLYRENIVKAKAKIKVDCSKAGLIESGDGGALDLFNVACDQLGASSWNGTGALTVFFLTELPSSHYSINFNFRSTTTDLIMGMVTSQNAGSFTITCYKWDFGAGDWSTFGVADDDFHVFIQVV